MAVDGVEDCQALAFLDTRLLHRPLAHVANLDEDHKQRVLTAHFGADEAHIPAKRTRGAAQGVVHSVVEGEREEVVA